MANLGSITTSKEVNLLDDIGTVAANDTVTIKVTINYTYQGQPASVELIQPVTMWGDNQ